MPYEFVALETSDVAQKIAKKCNKELFISEFRQFADGELNVKFSEYEQYKNKTVVIIQSTGHRVNELTLGVAFLAQLLKQAGAKKIIAVIPYLAYSRQDCSSIPGYPGHAQIVAQLFEAAGIDELIAVELHNESIIDLFTIPVTDISVRDTIAVHITEQFSDLGSVCLVAPDKGASDYVKAIGEKIGAGTITFLKKRVAADQTSIVDYVRECEGTVGIVIDDIISTGGTALHVCDVLPDLGYSTISGYFVHPVLAGDAIERLQNSCFRSIFVSNTLSLSPEINSLPFVNVFDISDDIVSVLKQKLSID